MSTKRQLPRFILVGATAALVHWSVFSGLLWLGLAPLLANPGGFLMAFCISYMGQRNLTFQAGDIPHAKAVPRYLLVSLASFLVNECLLALLVRYTPLPPQLSLAIVLVLVAAGTFVLSRHWAFSRRS